MSVTLYDSIAGTGCIAAVEQLFAGFIGTRFSVAMTNCTSALHAALLASGVHRGDEVIVPAYTWGGSITGVLTLGGLPVFADTDQTLTIAPAEVERKITRKTKAVIAVHLFGHPCDVAAISEICQRHKIALIEDCAQALGAAVNGKHVGSFGIGCFSFSSAKTQNFGEGGMLTTGNEEIFDRVLYHTQHPLRQLSQMSVLCDPNEFALNYRMHPLTAQALLAHFEQAIDRQRQRQNFFESLHKAIVQGAPPGLIPVTLREGVTHAWHKFSPAVSPRASDQDWRAIETFFGDYGCQIEKGYITQPLTYHNALNLYLSRRVARRVKQTSLQQTHIACSTRIGVRAVSSDLPVLLLASDDQSLDETAVTGD